MKVASGLDVLAASGFERLRGRRVGLLCNQASIAGSIEHALDLFLAAHRRGVLRLEAVFGPQHGLWGHTQDNMIEWEGGFRDPRTGVAVHSLYGERRKPTPAMLGGIDTLVVDLQDVGARYYTFIWTMALAMEACGEAGIEVVVLDRPNPIGGFRVEGPFRCDGFASFVGLHPLAVRHGMTIGEIARYLRETFHPSCRLDVVAMHGWRRDRHFEDTGLPFAMPSPNLPAVDGMVVYPGQCLLEATNLSEGRGTTRPFETFGAPFLDGWALAESLRGLALPGVVFRPLEFQPTFQKHAGKICGGCFLHVTDRRTFLPFRTTIAILREVIARHGESFAWKEPPYEYEFDKMPFDILVGNDWLRGMLEQGRPIAEMEERWQGETDGFLEVREPFLLYAE